MDRGGLRRARRPGRSAPSPPRCGRAGGPTRLPAPGRRVAGRGGRRVRGACEELFARAGEGARAEADVVVVSHVSPIKAAVAWALGAGDEVAWRLYLATASITRIGWGADGPVLHRYNETVSAARRTALVTIGAAAPAQTGASTASLVVALGRQVVVEVGDELVSPGPVGGVVPQVAPLQRDRRPCRRAHPRSPRRAGPPRRRCTASRRGRSSAAACRCGGTGCPTR